MDYETKVAPVEHKRRISEQEAWQRCTPAQRAAWFPHGRPTGKGTLAAPQYGDPVALDKATRAGLAAMAAGFGPPVRADRRVPCYHCARCDVGAYGRCQHAKSVAEARLLDGQARDARASRDRLVLVELEMLAVELAARLG
jgi:hypothetical protein